MQMLRFSSSSSTIRAIAASKLISASHRKSAVTRLASPPSPTVRAIPPPRITSASRHKFVAPNFVSRNFSTATATASGSIDDHELAVPAAPADFPFTIDKYREHDPQFRDNACMRGDFNGERLIVTIFKPETITEDLDKAVAADGSDHGVCLPGPVCLDVKIVKRSGTVALTVAICPHQLQVLMISFREKSYDGQLNNGRRHVLDGEGELQSAMQEYLEMRGIKPCYAEFMYRYMAWKSKNGTLEMVEKMKSFIKD